MHSNDKIPFEIIVRNASQDVNDKEFKNGLTRGWYLTKIRQALDELAYITNFDDQQPLDTAMPTSLMYKIPSGVWDIKEVYATDFDSTTGQVTTFARIIYKEHLNNQPYGGQGYTANRSDSLDYLNEPFGYWSVTPYYDTITGVQPLIFELNDGYMMLSSACSNYSGLRIIYAGTAGAIDQVPLIPRYFQKAIEDYVKYAYYQAMIPRNPRQGFEALAQEARLNLHDTKTGSWIEAKVRAVKATSKQRADWKEYQQRGNW